MPKYLKFTSLILIFAFILSGISICQVNSENCKVIQESSCCKKSDNYEKKALDAENCCCELKPASDQPAELNPYINLIKENTPHFTAKSFTDYESYNQNPIVHYRNSFHSPPQKDIYIINSNLRI